MEAFARRWPRFHGPERVSFTFQRSSGDLVDSGAQRLRRLRAPATFREWLMGTLDAEQIEDLASRGADSGWSSLIYTSECVELFDLYADEIREALNGPPQGLNSGNEQRE